MLNVSQVKDISWDKEYLIAEINMNQTFGKFKDLELAKRKLASIRSHYPNLSITIFERTSLTTWEGRFIAKEFTVDISQFEDL